MDELKLVESNGLAFWVMHMVSAHSVSAWSVFMWTCWHVVELETWKCFCGYSSRWPTSMWHLLYARPWACRVSWSSLLAPQGTGVLSPLSLASSAMWIILPLIALRIMSAQSGCWVNIWWVNGRRNELMNIKCVTIYMNIRTQCLISI